MLIQNIMKKSTTIQISEELRDALKDLGKKGESYEDIIWRLVKEGNKNKK
jgi:predicted CopG family antitoxin